MTNAAELLFPSATAAPPAAAPRQAAAPTAARLHPSASDASASPQAPQAQAQAAVEAPGAPLTSQAPPADEVTLEEPSAAALLFDDTVPTANPVRWNEKAVRPEEIMAAFDVPAHADRSPQGDAERLALANALAAAGAGRTLARELYRDVTNATAPGYQPVSEEVGLSALRATFGRRTDAKLSAARDLVAKAEQITPGIVDFLNRTGLGNDPALIRKLALRAAKISV